MKETRPRLRPWISSAVLSLGLVCAPSCGGSSHTDSRPSNEFDVGHVTVLTDQLEVGHVVELEFTLDALSAAEQVPLSFYLISTVDDDPDGTPEQYLLGSTVLPHAGMGLQTYTATLVVPPDMADVSDEVLERFQVVARVDPLDVFAEQDESDNQPLEEPVDAPVSDAQEETANLSLTKLTLDSPLVVLVDHDAAEDHEVIDGVEDDEDHHLSVTVEILLAGRDSLEDVPLTFWIEIPGATNTGDAPPEPDWWPLQAWPEEEEPIQGVALDPPEDDYAPIYTISRLDRGEPRQIHADLLIPSAGAQDPDSTYEKLLLALDSGGEFTVHVVIDAENVISEYEDPDSPHTHPTFGDNIASTDVLVVRPPQHPTAFLVAEESFRQEWTSDYAGVATEIDASARLDDQGAVASLQAHVPILLCGTEFDFVALDAHAKYVPDDLEDSAFELELTFAGLLLYTYSGNISEGSGLTDSGFRWDETFQVEKSKSATADFFIGPVPIDLSITASGQLGFDVDVSLGAVNLFSLEAEPFLHVGAVASLGIGNAVVSAGVSGSLDLIDERFSLAATCPNVTISGSGVTGQLRAVATNRLQGPSGSLDAYVQYPGIKWCRAFSVPYPCGVKDERTERTVITWAGYSKDDVLLDYYGAIVGGHVVLPGP